MQAAFTHRFTCLLKNLYSLYQCIGGISGVDGQYKLTFRSPTSSSWVRNATFLASLSQLQPLTKIWYGQPSTTLQRLAKFQLQINHSSWDNIWHKTCTAPRVRNNEDQWCTFWRNHTANVILIPHTASTHYPCKCGMPYRFAIGGIRKNSNTSLFRESYNPSSRQQHWMEEEWVSE